MKSITEIISDLSIDVACLLDEPEDVTKEDLIKMQDSITELENWHDLAPDGSHLRIGQAYLVDDVPMVLIDTSYGRYAFTDGRYGFGRTLGRRASDSKILDNLKIAEGVNPQAILDELSDSVQSMVEFNQGRKK
tara:strand:+ start:294 stop:695 length:402 start_codon:yes stop_codon:yes gene_type:complete